MKLWKYSANLLENRQLNVLSTHTWNHNTHTNTQTSFLVCFNDKSFVTQAK